VLRGLLGGSAVSVALPWLESLLPRSFPWAGREARADSGGFPLRFGIFFWGNGNLPERWTPVGEGGPGDWQLSEQLAPLLPVQHLVSVVSGTSVRVPNRVPHGSGAAGILTGMPLISENGSDTYAGPTLDQVIAAEIGTDTVFRSIQTAATNIVGLSYNGPNSPNPAETSPRAFFDRIFGSGGGGGSGAGNPLGPTLAARRSVLDAVLGDAGALRARVSAADKVRLDQHMDGIRELEQRLARLEEEPPELAACVTPAPPEAEYPDVDGRPQISERSRVFCDLVAMALACDLSRVFAHFLTEPVHNLLFPGASAGHHELTHNEPEPQSEVHEITIRCVEEFAYLVQALAAVPEGDATLLDHCAVLGTTEVSLGRTHSLDEFPLLIAGNAGGALRQGVHYRSYTQESASQVTLSLMRAVGVPATDWGVDDACSTDGLPEIEA
jgi:hypothetical protein